MRLEMLVLPRYSCSNNSGVLRWGKGTLDASGVSAVTGAAQEVACG